MSLDYINEAFRSLESLNEDIFSVDHDGINELSDFMSSDVDDEEKISIIDMDAETEDDLQDSYVGKIICDCNVCHSHVFKDKDQITIDEDGVVDIEDDCPYCGEHNGFVIIGEIAEFNPNAEKEVTEETPVEEEEVTEEPAEEVTESLNESLLTDYQKFVDRDDIDEADMMFEESIMPDIMDAAEKILTDEGYLDIEFDPDEFRDRVRASKDNVNYEAEFEIADQYEDFGSVLYNSKKYSDAVKKCANMYVEDIIANFKALTESLNESPRKFKPHTMKLLRMIGSDLVNDAVEEKLEESFNNVSIETDDQKMTMTSEENGKVTVTTEPIEEAPIAEEGEMIAPISDETQDEIINATAEVVEEEPAEEVVEETPVEEEEMDFDFDELDEEGMDELGESYLKRVYENVDSFKTSNVSTSGNKLFIEGMINFKSGASKKTGFIFEAKEATRDGKVKFMGENAHLCRGKRAFTLAGSLNENKLMVESLTYNYRAKNSDGKSTRVYGTISRNK